MATASPLSSAGPAASPPGPCAQTACLTDLFATFAQITGAEYGDGAGEDSVSLLPLLEGGDVPVRDTIVHHCADGSFSIRKGPWKLELCRASGGMRPPCTDLTLPPYQLYRLDSDIVEQYNLYDEQPEIAQALMELLKDQICAGRSTPGAPQENVPCDNWPGLDWMKA